MSEQRSNSQPRLRKQKKRTLARCKSRPSQDSQGAQPSPSPGLRVQAPVRGSRPTRSQRDVHQQGLSSRSYTSRRGGARCRAGHDGGKSDRHLGRLAMPSHDGRMDVLGSRHSRSASSWVIPRLGQIRVCVPRVGYSVLFISQMSDVDIGGRSDRGMWRRKG